MLVVSLAHIADAGSGKAGHSRTGLSALAEAIRLPSGLNATLDTGPVWTVSGRRSAGGWPHPAAAASCRRCRRRCSARPG